MQLLLRVAQGLEQGAKHFSKGVGMRSSSSWAPMPRKVVEERSELGLPTTDPIPMLRCMDRNNHSQHCSSPPSAHSFLLPWIRSPFWLLPAQPLDQFPLIWPSSLPETHSSLDHPRKLISIHLQAYFPRSTSRYI